MDRTLKMGALGSELGGAQAAAVSDALPTRFVNLAPALFGDAIDVPIGLWVGLRAAPSRTDFERLPDPFLSLTSTAHKGTRVVAGQISLGTTRAVDSALSVVASATSVEVKSGTWVGSPPSESSAIVFCKRRDIFFRSNAPNSPCPGCASREQCCDTGDFRAIIILAESVAGVVARPYELFSLVEFAELVGGLPMATLVDRARQAGDEVRVQMLTLSETKNDAFVRLANAVSPSEGAWRDTLTAKLNLCLAVATEAKLDPITFFGDAELAQRVRVSLASDSQRGDAPWRFALSVAAPLPIPVAPSDSAASFKGSFSILAVDESPEGASLRVNVKANETWSSTVEVGRRLTLHFGSEEGFVTPMDVALELDRRDGEHFLLHGLLGNVAPVAITQLRILRHLRGLEMAFTVKPTPIVAVTPSAPTLSALGELLLTCIFTTRAQSVERVTEAIARVSSHGKTVEMLTRNLATESAFAGEKIAPGSGQQARYLLDFLHAMAAKLLTTDSAYPPPLEGGLEALRMDLEQALNLTKQPVSATVLGGPVAPVSVPTPPAVGDSGLADVLASLISDTQWLDKVLALDHARPAVAAAAEPKKAAAPIPPVVAKPPPVTPKPVPIVRAEPENVDLDATMVVSHEQLRQAFRDEKITMPTAASAPKVAPIIAKEPAREPGREPGLDETMIVAPGWRPESKK